MFSLKNIKKMVSTFGSGQTATDVNIYVSIPDARDVLLFAYNMKFTPENILWQLRECNREIESRRETIVDAASPPIVKSQPIGQIWLDIVQKKITLITGNVIVNPWDINIIKDYSTTYRLVHCGINGEDYLLRAIYPMQLNIMFLHAPNIELLSYVVLNNTITKYTGNPLDAKMYNVCVVIKYDEKLINAKLCEDIILTTLDEYSLFFQRVFDLFMGFWEHNITFLADDLPIYVTEDLVPFIVDYTHATVCKTTPKPIPEYDMPIKVKFTPRTMGFRRATRATFDTLPESEFKEKIMEEYKRIWGIYRNSMYDH